MTTERKSEAISDARMDFAGLMTAQHAGRETLRTAFGMKTLTKKQQSETTEYENTRTN